MNPNILIFEQYAKQFIIQLKQDELQYYSSLASYQHLEKIFDYTTLKSSTRPMEEDINLLAPHLQDYYQQYILEEPEEIDHKKDDDANPIDEEKEQLLDRPKLSEGGKKNCILTNLRHHFFVEAEFNSSGPEAVEKHRAVHTWSRFIAFVVAIATGAVTFMFAFNPVGWIAATALGIVGFLFNFYLFKGDIARTYNALWGDKSIFKDKTGKPISSLFTKIIIFIFGTGVALGSIGVAILGFEALTNLLTIISLGALTGPVGWAIAGTICALTFVALAANSFRAVADALKEVTWEKINRHRKKIWQDIKTGKDLLKYFCKLLCLLVGLGAAVAATVVTINFWKEGAALFFTKFCEFSLSTGDKIAAGLISVFIFPRTLLKLAASDVAIKIGEVVANIISQPRETCSKACKAMAFFFLHPIQSFANLWGWCTNIGNAIGNFFLAAANTPVWEMVANAATAGFLGLFCFVLPQQENYHNLGQQKLVMKRKLADEILSKNTADDVRAYYEAFENRIEHQVLGEERYWYQLTNRYAKTKSYAQILKLMKCQTIVAALDDKNKFSQVYNWQTYTNQNQLLEALRDSKMIKTHRIGGWWNRFFYTESQRDLQEIIRTNPSKKANLITATRNKYNKLAINLKASIVSEFKKEFS